MMSYLCAVSDAWMECWQWTRAELLVGTGVAHGVGQLNLAALVVPCRVSRLSSSSSSYPCLQSPLVDADPVLSTLGEGLVVPPPPPPPPPPIRHPQLPAKGSPTAREWRWVSTEVGTDHRPAPIPGLLQRSSNGSEGAAWTNRNNAWGLQLAL